MGRKVDIRRDGKQLFEQETFDGNERTCLTCHSRETGTVSPEDAQKRFGEDPHDPLLLQTAKSRRRRRSFSLNTGGIITASAGRIHDGFVR